MHIWAIGDLHLSFDAVGKLQKPMDIFGAPWQNHAAKIADFWQNHVAQDDLVLLAGDLSWAMTAAAAVQDIAWINKLPGHKVAVRGNHDYWWGGAQKTRALLAPTAAIMGDSVLYGDYAICGAKGYQCALAESDKLLKREAARLEQSLIAGQASKKQIIVLLHYPPYNIDGSDNCIGELVQKYEASCVLYAHLHNPSDIYRYNLGAVKLQPVSADYLNFQLLQLI